MSAIGRRAGVDWVRCLAAVDPAFTPTDVYFYGKDVAGVTQAFVMLGDGSVQQLTPLGTRVYSPPEQWAQSNVAASQTDVALGALVSQSFNTVKAIRAGSIVGLGTRLSEPITAGTLVVGVTLNGLVTVLTLSHDSGTNPSGGEAVAAIAAIPYVAGDLIGVQLSTNAGFLPITTDLEAWIQLAEPVL